MERGNSNSSTSQNINNNNNGVLNSHLHQSLINKKKQKLNEKMIQKFGGEIPHT